MKIIKTFLILVLVVVLAGAGLIVASRYLPILQALNSKVPVGMLPANVQEYLGKAEQGLGQAQQVSQVIGAQGVLKNLQASSSAQQSSVSLPEKAFEYTRYQYCQQVIKDYDARSSQK